MSRQTALQVSFRVKVYTYETTAEVKDTLYVSLQPASTLTLSETLIVDNTTVPTDAWQLTTLTYNELPYAGQPMRLYFHGATDAFSFTNFFVDNVSVQVQCARYPTPEGVLADTPVFVKIEPAPDAPGAQP